jgi:hypothetical protein
VGLAYLAFKIDREEGREHLGKLLTITHDPNAAI